jgi:isoamylase
MKVWPGRPYPLGATWDGEGVNFSLFSENATSVELCLFDGPDASKESHRIRMEERTNQTWHVYLPEGRPGLHYGFRVDGPYDPQAGHRFNPAKLLIDPYAKSIADTIRLSDRMFGYRLGEADGDLVRDDRDNAEEMPKCVVVDQAFSWGGDHLLRTPWSKTIIYEVHVKGFTARHPQVPEHLRGTYAGLSTPAVIEYLQELGVTAVELLPVHHAVQDKHLTDQGLTNYWGYNTIGFFAPDMRYAASPVRGRHVREFKTMVKALHRAGIEVILDVVYNHTAEGDELGPTSRSAAGQRHLLPAGRTDDRATPTTRAAATRSTPTTRGAPQLILDSLRYWVQVMHVDGFRFDLAAILSRDESGELYRLARRFWDIDSDPALAGTKLIAEAWDAAGLYQVGSFAGDHWKEWNGQFRDDVRSTSCAATAVRPGAGRAADGQPATSTATTRREPAQSINFVTSHDGFTLNDLVSYNASTTRPTARTTATGTTTTAAGTAASRADRRPALCWSCARVRSRTCWPSTCWRWVRPCC